jgi:S-formylglutathione hydrolase
MKTETNIMTVRSEYCCFGGIQGFYAHRSWATGTEMRFALYLPSQAKAASVPVLYFLAGLTCTEETFPIKAGAQRFAAQYGIALVAPDTSPRGADIAGEDDDWDFGTGAGFYVDATESPWVDHYRMYSYVVDELPALIAARFPVDVRRQGVFGHSMGGHGALVIALRNPNRYRSVSAFAPIAAPSQVPWGEKAFSGYLGADRAAWHAYDASKLVARSEFSGEILVDQGMEDQFLDVQLRPELLVAPCLEAGRLLTLRRHEGYDHSYYFIASFIEDHMRHHAAVLLN